VISGEGNYDAIVLDRRLPDGDGLSLMPKLREGGNAASVPGAHRTRGACMPNIATESTDYMSRTGCSA
jgi:hypothetical protein